MSEEMGEDADEQGAAAGRRRAEEGKSRGNQTDTQKIAPLSNVDKGGPVATPDEALGLCLDGHRQRALRGPRARRRPLQSVATSRSLSGVSGKSRIRSPGAA